MNKTFALMLTTLVAGLAGVGLVWWALERGGQPAEVERSENLGRRSLQQGLTSDLSEPASGDGLTQQDVPASSPPSQTAEDAMLNIPSQQTGNVASDEAVPPPQIEIGNLPKQATMVDDVVVPIPSEIFLVLDKVGKPNWAMVLRPLKRVVGPGGSPEDMALLLGSVIGEGFIAVEAENAGEVKKIGRSVQNLARALGVEKTVTRRAGAIIQSAERRNWIQVRQELDGALEDGREAMIELSSEPRAQLVSLGGWLRGIEAVAAVVSANYTPETAELLHQSGLVTFFERALTRLPERMQTAFIADMRQSLAEIRTLMGDGTSPPGAGEVSEIHKISARLVGRILTQRDPVDGRPMTAR